MLDKEYFLKVCGVMNKYYKFDIEPDVMEINYAVIKNLCENDEFKKACYDYMQNERFFPNPFCPNIKPYLDRIKKNYVLSSGSAWCLILTAVKRFGSNSANSALKWIYKENPLAYKIIRQIGFSQVCLCNENKELQWYRKDFISNYEDSVNENIKFEEDDADLIPKLSLKNGNVLGYSEKKQVNNDFNRDLLDIDKILADKKRYVKS